MKAMTGCAKCGASQAIHEELGGCLLGVKAPTGYEMLGKLKPLLEKATPRPWDLDKFKKLITKKTHKFSDEDLALIVIAVNLAEQLPIFLEALSAKVEKWHDLEDSAECYENEARRLHMELAAEKYRQTKHDLRKCAADIERIIGSKKE